MKKMSFEWWLGQAMAMFLGVCVIGVYGGVAGYVTIYLIFVLVDIREYLKAFHDKIEENK